MGMKRSYAGSFPWDGSGHEMGEASKWGKLRNGRIEVGRGSNGKTGMKENEVIVVRWDM